MVAAVGEPPKDRPNRGRELTGAVTPARVVMDRNRMILILTDIGDISSGSAASGGGFWRSPTDQYIFTAGPAVGAIIPDGQIVFYSGGPFANTGSGGPVFSGQGLDDFFVSTDPADEGAFPDVCTVDDFRIANFPSLVSFRGEPFPGFADITVCTASNDITIGTCRVCGGLRVGLEIVEVAFQFSVPVVQDFTFFIFRVFNRTEFINAGNSPLQPPGPYDLTDTVVAYAIDPDVGSAGDDQMAFFPDAQTMVWWDSDFVEPEFQNPPGIGGVTYLKTPVDPATGEEVGLAEFTVFTNGNPRPDPPDNETWYALMIGDPAEVVLEVGPQDIRGMASSRPFPLPAGEFVEIYAAIFFADISGSPPAQLLAEGYKNLATGELIPDANDDPIFDNFRNVQRTAQAAADAGFVVPIARSRPGTELIPGDGQVTILWDDTPVSEVNPFAKIALDPFARSADGLPDPEAPGLGIFVPAEVAGEPTVIFDPLRDIGGLSGFVTAAEAGFVGTEVTNSAFNLGFVIQDFQGFNVYRSFTGLADDAELIAQFDIPDFIVGRLFCNVAEVAFDPEGDFAGAVCTEPVTLNIGADTGLSFAVIDRGGSFPDPSTGPGLINGIPISYVVTAFAVNTGQSPITRQDAFDFLNGGATPAAPLVLESGLSPLLSATPRSNASSFVNAVVGSFSLLDGSGTALPLPSGPIPVDAGGALSGPIPPAQDFDVRVGIIQPEAIPANFEAQIHIDDTPYAAAFNDGFCGGAVNAPGCGDMPLGTFEELPVGDGRGVGVDLSVTDGNGNVLQTPLGPAVNFRAAFGALSFDSDNGPIDGPIMEILAPEDPSLGVAFTLQFVLGGAAARSNNCGLRNVCELLTADGSGLPASVNAFNFSRLAYGMSVITDVEVTWSNQGGVLGFNSVRDISNNVEWAFSPNPITKRWGFARPTSLRAAEDAVATAADTPRTTDGKVLFPEPYCSEIRGPAALRCDVLGVDGMFTQGAPIWEDLPFDPEIFDKLAPATALYLTDPELMQPGALQETAALYTRDGLQGTRLAIAGHWLTVEFNQLPADGETWLLRFPSGGGTLDGVNPNSVRPPTPGTTISVPLTGGSSELANADLSQVLVVPNPFIAADEIQRGFGLQQILFTNLPPQATIRIYTISGNLLRVIEHLDESGTEAWDVRTRFDLIVASGNYYFHVTTPDGRTSLGRFAVIN